MFIKIKKDNKKETQKMEFNKTELSNFRKDFKEIVKNLEKNIIFSLKQEVFHMMKIVSP